MAPEFDPYEAWLGIPRSDQPPDHYRLLGIPRFESDPNLIAAAARSQMARVSAYLVGPHATLAQQVLADLAAAKHVLLSPDKAEYDGGLRGRDTLRQAAHDAAEPQMGFVGPATAQRGAPARRADAPPLASTPAGATTRSEPRSAVPRSEPPSAVPRSEPRSVSGTASPSPDSGQPAHPLHSTNAAQQSPAAELLPPTAAGMLPPSAAAGMPTPSAAAGMLPPTAAGISPSQAASTASQSGTTVHAAGSVPEDLLPPAAIAQPSAATQQSALLWPQPAAGQQATVPFQVTPCAASPHVTGLAQAPSGHGPVAQAPLVQVPLGQALAHAPLAQPVPHAPHVPLANTAQLVGFAPLPSSPWQPVQGVAMPAAPLSPIPAGSLPAYTAGAQCVPASPSETHAAAIHPSALQLPPAGPPLYRRRTRQSNAAAWGILGSLLAVLALVVYFVATTVSEPSPEEGTAIASAKGGSAGQIDGSVGGGTSGDSSGTQPAGRTASRVRGPDSNNPHRQSGTQGNPAPSDETEPAAERPSNSKPTDNRPPSADSPEHTISDDNQPAHEMPDGTMPDGTMPDGTMPDGTMPDGTMPDESMPDESMPDESMPDESMPDDDMPHNGMPDETMPEGSSPEGSGANRSVTDDAASQPDPEGSPVVVEALAAARKALAERDLDRADEQLDLAIVAAGNISSVLATRIEGEQALAAAVRAFWDAVKASMSQLEGTEELRIGNSIAIVVEVDGETIIIREAGRNQRYSIRRGRNARPLPPRLALALAERWLKSDDPSSKLVIGAFLAVDPQGDRGRANDYLLEAEQRGAEAAALVRAALEDSAE